MQNAVKLLYNLCIFSLTFFSKTLDKFVGKWYNIGVNKREEKNKMNAREQAYYNSYMQAKHATIFTAYKNPSEAKRKAWVRHCKDSPENAECVAILSHNCQFFTMAYLAIINDIPTMVVITPYHKYGIKLTVDEYRLAREYNYQHVI